jgi:hypothetical protein
MPPFQSQRDNQGNVMRADMSKVLVEEPRHGRAFARAVVGSRRQDRHRLDRDGESAPARFGMKQGGGCKHFGEHLGPLFGYLRQQVDRPWSKVWGELCATLDRRNTIQAHLFQHIEDQVDLNTEWRDGEVWVRGRWGSPKPLAESRAELYVHPRTGILLVNRARLIAQRRQREAKAREVGETDRRIGLRGMTPDTQWHRQDGVWYSVTLARLDPRSDVPVYDALLKRLVSHKNRALLLQLYDNASLHATSKQQLDTRTLRRHGLAGG